MNYSDLLHAFGLTEVVRRYDSVTFPSFYRLYRSGALMRILPDGTETLVPPQYDGDYPYWEISTPHGGFVVQCHHFMADAFIPNPQNLPVVVHRDGDKNNWDLENLAWSSIGDAVARKPQPPETQPVPKASSTTDLVRDICELIQCGMTDGDIAHALGATPLLVTLVRTRRRYVNISQYYDFPTN